MTAPGLRVPGESARNGYALTKTGAEPGLIALTQRGEDRVAAPVVAIDRNTGEPLQIGLAAVNGAPVRGDLPNTTPMAGRGQLHLRPHPALAK